MSAEGRAVNMKWKLASAFATGALLASGIVYFAVRQPANEEEPKRTAAVYRTAPVPAPPAPPPKVAPARVATPVPMPHSVVREKPSPMPPPVRHEKPVAVAKYNPPPVPSVEPKQVPAPAPVASGPAPPAPQQSVPVENVSLPPPAAPPAIPPTVDTRVAPSVTLAAGTLLPVRIGENLSSARNQPGDSFLATLIEPLVVNGWVIAEPRARLEGRVVDSTQAGRVKGAAHLEISIVRVALSDGQTIRVRTEPYVRDGDSAGGIIGALIRRKPAEIPVETRVVFHVLDSLTITERVN
jgi:outer membrane biosynthesis protein TonB